MRLRYDKKAIKRIRLERGLSVVELAKAARITSRTLNYIEHGYSDPRATTMAKIATVLGVTVDAFYLRKDEAA
jgi:transcriptional regulator with XRE-family HTH domain